MIALLIGHANGGIVKHIVVGHRSLVLNGDINGNDKVCAIARIAFPNTIERLCWCGIFLLATVFNLGLQLCQQILLLVIFFCVGRHVELRFRNGKLRNVCMALRCVSCFRHVIRCLLGCLLLSSNIGVFFCHIFFRRNVWSRLLSFRCFECSFCCNNGFHFFFRFPPSALRGSFQCLLWIFGLDVFFGCFCFHISFVKERFLLHFSCFLLCVEIFSSFSFHAINVIGLFFCYACAFSFCCQRIFVSFFNRLLVEYRINDILLAIIGMNCCT